jgi:excinuclease ABC subunit C
VSGLFPAGAFAGFGRHRLYPWIEPVAVHQVHARPKVSLRALVRQQCPRHPGVYGMVSGDGELIYVGKAKSLRARLLGYFRPRGRDRRVRRILASARRLAWEFAPSEFAALLRELELIRQWRPRCNVQGQPRLYRRAFVCLGKRPAPYVYLARKPPLEVVACFGPVFPGPRLKEAIRRLNDGFRLRDCPQAQEMIFAGAHELFPVIRPAGCIRYEIGTCLGPCAAACTQSTYGKSVRAARAFLDGSDRSLLQTLERDEHAAAAVLNFERAAALRDQRQALDWLVRHLERVRQAQDEHTFVYPVAGHGGRDLWYLIRRGWVVTALPTPRLPEEHRAAAEQIDKIFVERAPWSAPAGIEQIDTVLLVAAWFRKHPQERARCLSALEALDRCRKARRRRA